MEIHPVEGARMLINTPGVPDLAPIVAFEHHIRPDGGGYPKVPRGWRLSLASRVVQLVDVFDALRTNRTYRPGLPLPRIVEVMKSEVGTFFDADLLQVFLQEVVSRGLPEPFA
jgi:HD-GYP domain-containing protein (c-di-GMP phosphodiesterase class II)